MRSIFCLLWVYLVFGIACDKADKELIDAEEEPIDTVYKIVSDHELVNDSFVHDSAYTFQLEDSVNGVSKEKGRWEVQLQKKDSTFFSILTKQQESELFIEPNSLTDLITETERFLYEGVQIIGRILFAPNDQSFSVEKRILILGKPAKPILRVFKAEDSGYPDENDIFYEDIILEFICEGATSAKIIQKEYDDWGLIVSVSSPVDINSGNFIAEVDKDLKTTFQLVAINGQGERLSDIITILPKNTQTSVPVMATDASSGQIPYKRHMQLRSNQLPFHRHPD